MGILYVKELGETVKSVMDSSMYRDRVTPHSGTKDARKISGVGNNREKCLLERRVMDKPRNYDEMIEQIENDGQKCKK